MLTQSQYQVFISYSSKNTIEAHAALSAIERDGFKCWIAPRDIVPGTEWGEAIIAGIEQCRIMVLVFSEHANDSPQVRREVERALSKGLTVIPFRIEDVKPRGSLEYGLSNTHWLDAFRPPRDRHYQQLVEVLERLLDERSPAATVPTAQLDSMRTADDHVHTEASRDPRRFAAIGAIFVLVLLTIGAILFDQRNKNQAEDDKTTTSQESNDQENSDRIAQTPLPSQAPLVVEANYPLSANAIAAIQKSFAQNRQLPLKRELDIGSGVILELVLIPPGSFLMGESTDDGHFTDARPHHVKLSHGYYMGATHITVAQYAMFIKDNPDYPTEGLGDVWQDDDWNHNVATASFRDPGFVQAPNHPVVEVNWSDANAFCAWVSTKLQMHCRLPTEAEWEYSCRAGSQTAFPWGDNPSDGLGWANCADLSAKSQFPRWPTFDWNDGYIFTSPVGSFKPNALGLYDMIGNAFQWCTDFYGPYAGDEIDPQGASQSTTNVLRGGSWYTAGASCYCGFRSRRLPTERTGAVGFRIVVDIE